MRTLSGPFHGSLWWLNLVGTALLFLVVYFAMGGGVRGLVRALVPTALLLLFSVVVMSFLGWWGLAGLYLAAGCLFARWACRRSVTLGELRARRKGGGR